MFEPYTLTTMLLGGGLVASSGALIAQAGGKRRAVRAAAERVAQTEQKAAGVQSAHGHELAKAQATYERELKTVREQAATNWDWCQAVVAEARHLAERRLPALVDTVVRGYEGVAAPGLLHQGFAGTAVEEAYVAAEALVREALETSKVRTGRSARAGVRGMADEAQAYLTRLQMKIDEELGRHPAAGAYHQGLTDIDHAATLALHQLQRLRVLAGSWPGLQRANATFREVIESARGRIPAYDRVRYTYLPDTGELYVEGRVAEPIIVALAELMANAAAYSSDSVEVYVQQVRVGVSIVVQDAGLGMNSSQRAAAERLLSHRAVMDVTELGDERKLGFAVVGRLSHDYAFRVDVGSPSATGGVKAVLLVPAALLGDAPAEEFLAVRSARERSWRQVEDPADVPAALSTAAGLPKRQPRAAPAARTSAPTQEALTDTTDPAELDAGFARLGEALSAGYADPTPPKDDSDDL